MAHAFELQLETLSQEKKSLGIKLPEFPPMVLNHLKQQNKGINKNTPETVAPMWTNFLLFLYYRMIGSPNIFQCCILQLKSHVCGFVPMSQLFFVRKIQSIPSQTRMHGQDVFAGQSPLLSLTVMNPLMFC